MRNGLGDEVKIMGILNVTPDSFSDGGDFLDIEAAVGRAKEMVSEGAEIIDVGGESTGPGSMDVALDEEMQRVVPVIEKLRRELYERVLISVDTWKYEVAKAAVEAGAEMINDVTALRGDERMAGLVAESGVKVVLMYSKDESARTSGEGVEYDDVVATVKEFLLGRVEYAVANGVRREQIVLDPGMGAFVSGIGRYSWEILERLDELVELGFPVLVGASRKSFTGELVVERDENWDSVTVGFRDGEKLPVEERLEGSLACALLAKMKGVEILRVHDVKDTKNLLESSS